jgi:hypothetical protein
MLKYMGVFVKGELTPDTAMKALTIFEGKFTRQNYSNKFMKNLQKMLLLVISLYFYRMVLSIIAEKHSQ